MMQFGYTIIYVADVEASMIFYKNAFNLEEHFLHESKQYGYEPSYSVKMVYI